jgi:flagellar export protein FliJ
MAVFSFPLQPLLDRHVAAEDAARRALLDARAAASQAAVALAALQADFSRYAARLRDRVSPLPAGDVRATLLEIELVRAALRRQALLADAAGQNEAAARMAFETARAERRRLQTLRDRIHATYLLERERREAAETDDANARRNTISP